MNREIKFRGKRTKTEDPLERWIEGSYIEYTNIRGEKIVRIMSESGYMNDVDPNTVGQYTGIKDKNGKEIYEGDIIECISCNGKPIRHYIKFCDERGCYAQYGKGTSAGELYECGPICQHYIDEIGKYVIGNIHDNPELLNKND